MLRVSMAIGLAGLTTGCNLTPSEIADCRAHILSNLKSPSSFKEITSDSTLIEHELNDPESVETKKSIKRIDEELGKSEKLEPKPPYQMVMITYDASNSFGALLRKTDLCQYGIANGEPDISKRLYASIDNQSD